jgi:hypothetical protein
MERLVLTPATQEITVNAGADEGAVDVFSYDSPDHNAAGSLVVIGHRLSDSANMGYMVSLIAALARREYYAVPGEAPKDAFTRTLHKLNEVVDEFAKSQGADLSVGIVAITGGTILVSKLDKFKILLAREGQVIDILNNVMLFSKEHVERRRFSSVVSGSVQPGDRLLAFVPSRGITTRERNLKTWLVKMEPDEFTERVQSVGQQNPGWGASFVRVDMVQVPQPAAQPIMQAPDLEPRLANAHEQHVQESSLEQPPTLAWAPRQRQAPAPVAAATDRTAPVPQPEPETPHLIATEYSLATRSRPWSRLGGIFRLVRLDNRGKAAVLAGIALFVIGSVVAVKSLFFVDEYEQQLRASLETITRDIDTAKSQIARDDASQARQTLLTAAAALAALPQDDDRVRDAAASVTEVLDGMDYAQDATASVLAQPAKDQEFTLATWSSQSASVWAVARGADASLALVELKDGAIVAQTPVAALSPDIIQPFLQRALLVDTAAKTIARFVNGELLPFVLTTPDAINDVAVFDGNVYVLTGATILKISDLETQKPVTKIWPAEESQFTPASRIWIDGSIYTLGRDGTLTTYYKGERTAQQSVPLAPSGSWRLAGGPDNLLSIASADTLRVHLIDRDGTLVRTLKLDSQQRVRSVGEGPDGSTLMVTDDGRIWLVK